MKSVALIKVPQILGAGLAANIFIAIALQIKILHSAEWPAYVALFYAFLLNLKDFFDDMKSYEVSNIEGFSLFPTITFRLFSYLSIAWAVSLLPDYRNAFRVFSGYFIVFIFWSINSIVRRSRLQSKSQENAERLRRRWGWLVIYFFSSVTCLSVFYMYEDSHLFLAFCLIAILYVMDVIDSDSFSSQVNETL